MTDFTILSRTVLALLWTYPASNPFLLARLAGHSECDVVSVLGELERKGLIAESNGRICGAAPTGEAAGAPMSDSLRPWFISLDAGGQPVPQTAILAAAFYGLFDRAVGDGPGSLRRGVAPKCRLCSSTPVLIGDAGPAAGGARQDLSEVIEEAIAITSVERLGQVPHAGQFFLGKGRWGRHGDSQSTIPATRRRSAVREGEGSS
jgi:hypothetical protein